MHLPSLHPPIASTPLLHPHFPKLHQGPYNMYNIQNATRLVLTYGDECMVKGQVHLLSPPPAQAYPQPVSKEALPQGRDCASEARPAGRENKERRDENVTVAGHEQMR